MAEPTLKEKRRGLEFADLVAELAARAPDGFSKTLLYQARNTMQRHYGFSDADKRRHIAIFLHAGCSNLEELCREMGMPKAVVSEMVGKMEADHEIEITPLSVSTGGRPRSHIRLLVSKTHFVTPKN